MKHIVFAFELAAPDCLRLIASHKDGPVIDIAEAVPGPDCEWTFYAVWDLIGGQKSLTVTTGYSFDPGRAAAPKTLIKRAVRAATEVHEQGPMDGK